MLFLPFLVILVGFDGTIKIIVVLLKIRLCDIVPRWLLEAKDSILDNNRLL